MTCRICGDPKTLARQRCGTCYRQWWRTGKDRTFELIARTTRRDIDRDLARQRGH